MRWLIKKFQCLKVIWRSQEQINFRVLLFHIISIFWQSSMEPHKPQIVDQRESFKKHIVHNNEQFQAKIEKNENQHHANIKQLNIFYKKDEPHSNTFYYEAQKYHSDSREDLENFIAKQIHNFLSNNKHGRSYCIAYIHSSFVDFIIFRRIMEKWPQHFFNKLRRVYVVGATFMVKFIETFSFGTFYRQLDTLIVNLDTMDQLAGADAEVLKEIGEMIQVNKGEKEDQRHSYKLPPIKIIKSPIYGKELHQYELHDNTYPLLVLKLLKKILSKPQYVQFEGIFRKSCDSEELEKLEGEIIKNNWEYLRNEDDVLVVCGCLKKIFNNLETPLYSYEIYAQIINFSSTGEPSELEFIRMLMKSMPKVNYKTVILLMAFLSEYIVGNVMENKMNAYNLAVVFGPCFFRPREYDLKDLINSGKFSKIILLTLTKFAEIIDPKEANLARNLLAALKGIDNI